VSLRYAAHAFLKRSGNGEEVWVWAAELTGMK